MSDYSVEILISSTIPLIGSFIEDKEEYESDIKCIFERISDVDLLFALVNQEQNEYSEYRTLRIADILMAASALPHKVNGCYYTYPDNALRQKPALYFYERASANNSIKAMGKVAHIITGGCGDIKKNPERAKKLYKYAAEHGDLMSLSFSEYSIDTLKNMAENGNIMAYVIVFEKYYEKGNKFFAKLAINKFINSCTVEQKKEVVNWLASKKISDYSSAIDYITGNSNDFRIVNEKMLYKTMSVNKYLRMMKHKKF